MDKSKRFVWITNQSTILPISKPPSHSQGTPKKLLVQLTGAKRLQISPLPLHRNTTELPAVECLERKKCVWVMWVEHDCACPRSLGAQLQAATHRRDDELGRPALSQDRRRASCQQHSPATTSPASMSGWRSEANRAPAPTVEASTAFTHISPCLGTGFRRLPSLCSDLRCNRGQMQSTTGTITLAMDMDLVYTQKPARQASENPC